MTQIDVRDAPEFEYDPFSIEAKSNPLPFYEVLREQHPVYYSERYDTFFISRFEDIWDVLSDHDDTFLATEGTVVSRVLLQSHNEGPVPDNSLDFFLSGSYGSPLYEVGRQAHGGTLRPGSVSKLDGFIRSVARERLDALLPQGRFDVTQEYGGIVSASTICHLYRLPLSIAKTVLDAVNAASRADSDEGFNVEASLALADLIAPRIAERRAEGPDGSWPLIDGFLDLTVAGRKLSDLEIAMNLLCVLVGGTETLPKIIGHGLMELWRHPEQLAEVRADLELNSAAVVEEMIRYCGPAQWFLRTVRKPTTIAGTPVRPGQRVAWLTGSANRDPREFDRPDEFIWNRPIPRTLAFGLGQHFCIGVHLARLEGRILVEEFLGRVAEYDVDLEAAVRLPSSFQWGYNVMPIVIKRLA